MTKKKKQIRKKPIKTKVEIPVTEIPIDQVKGRQRISLIGQHPVIDEFRWKVKKYKVKQQDVLLDMVKQWNEIHS